jgi:hypothetical protein
VITSTIALGAVGCGGGGGGGGGSSISFTKGAMASLPAVGTTAPGVRGLAAAIAPGNVAGYQSLAYLFRLECQHGLDDNYCPSSVTFDPNDLMDPTRFEMGSLIGMIFHAQMYTGTLVTDCSGSGLSPMTVSAGSYVAGDALNASANPTRFVLADYGLLTCQSTNVSDTSKETRVVSAVADGSYQAALHTRHQYDAGNGPQTDFFQVYVAMDAGTPTFLAFNFAAATPHASRPARPATTSPPARPTPATTT